MFLIIKILYILFILGHQEITKVVADKTIDNRCRHYASKKPPSRGKPSQEIIHFNSFLLDSLPYTKTRPSLHTKSAS